MDKCFYCKDVDRVASFRNPYTNEIHLTCAACRLEFTAYQKERFFFSKVALIWIPIFILASLVFIFFNWWLGLCLLAIGVLLEVIAVKAQSYFIKKWNIACGTYVDPKQITWCKTCLHFRKVKGFDNTMNGIWKSENMPEPERLPCNILNDSMETWRSFFSLDTSKRTLYPNNCPKWEKR